MACRIAILFGLPLLFVATAPAMAQQAPLPAASTPSVSAPAASRSTTSVPAASAPLVPAAPAPATPAVAPPAVAAPVAPSTAVAAPKSPAPTPPPLPVVEKAAAPILNPPLPLKRPVISEMTIPAGALFSQKKWPSVGKPRAIGYYPRGCLQGGVELPIDGANWQVMRLARNRNWGHPELIRFLERFAPLAAKATGWHGILIGDMAQPRGGPLPYGHVSHQVGLDVDIWFKPMPDHRLTAHERNTISANSLVAPDWKHVDPKTWSAADAAFIRTAAEQPEVERVLVNAAIKKKLCEMEGKHHFDWMKKVRPWYGHNDHMHVRLRCPTDSPHCRHQSPVPGTDGCDKSLNYWFSDRVLHPKPPKHPKPRKYITLADMPRACKGVLEAAPRILNAGTSNALSATKH
jgi:penicillin-insensitive murein endopeptidase